MRVRVPLPAPLKKQKLLVLVGPTSSGKSALAVELARKFGGEVISADSRQVYRGLDIGTGKITKREMRGVRHHLLDVASPKKVFTANDYRVRAQCAIATVVGKGRLPILCGGTGFYIDALVGRIGLPDVPADAKLRAKLKKKTAAQLFAMLRKRDPQRARTIDPHNTRRLIRAIEIAAALGRAPNVRTKVSPYELLWIGLRWDKDELRRRIRARLSARLRHGMVAEARRLHEGGLSYKRMEALGLEYRSLARFLQGKVSRGEMEEGLVRDITRYAKRQMTYWSRNKEIKWFSPSSAAKVDATVRSFIGK